MAEEVAAAELMLRRIKSTEREILSALGDEAALTRTQAAIIDALSRYERRARSRLRRASATVRIFQIGGRTLV